MLPAGSCAVQLQSYMLLTVCHTPNCGVIRAGKGQELVALAWSPAGCRRVLLTATKAGTVTAWSQLPSDASLLHPITMTEWSSSIVAAELGPTVAVQFLHSPCAWVWDADVVAAADFRQHGVESMFQAPEPPQGEHSNQDILSWLRPGRLAVAIVLQSGAVMLCWSSAGADSHLQWNLTPSIRLPGTAASCNPKETAATAESGGPDSLSSSTSSIVLADATAGKHNSTHAAYTLASATHQVQVASISGDPMHAMPRGSASTTLNSSSESSSLAVQGLPSIQLSPDSEVISLHWDPSSNGQRVCIAAKVSSQNTNNSNSNDLGTGQVVAAMNGADGQQQQLHEEGNTAARQCAGDVVTVYWYSLSDQGWIATAEHAIRPDMQVGKHHHGHARSSYKCYVAPDGHAVVVAVANQWHLLDAKTLQPVGLHLQPPATRAMAVAADREDDQQQCTAAFSPSAVGVACACNDHTFSRLVVWCTPDQCFAAGSADDDSCARCDKAVAARLAWAVVCRHHTWDVVQLLLQYHHHQQQHLRYTQQQQQTGVCDAYDVITRVMRLVDTLVHVHPQYTSPLYSLAWDRIKLAISGACNKMLIPAWNCQP